MTLIAGMIVLIAAYAAAYLTLDSEGLEDKVKECENETYRRLEGKE